MNHHSHTYIGEAKGGQVAEGKGGCSAAYASSAEGMTEALVGSGLHSDILY